MRTSKTKKLAERKAWRYFSEYVRRRDADHRGLCRCMTCGRWRHWKDMDAGHFISIEKQATKFDEKNVHAQCPNCNRFKSGKQYEHGKAIDELYGAGTADKLLLKSKMLCRRRHSDFERIALDYKNKIKELESVDDFSDLADIENPEITITKL